MRLSCRCSQRSTSRRRRSRRRRRRRGAVTHSTGDRSEGGHPLDVVGVAASESIALRVLSPLQDKLLSLVGGVLVTHPAAEEEARHSQYFYIKLNSSISGTLSLLLTLRSPPWGSARSRSRTPSRCSTRRWTHGDGPGSTPHRRQWSVCGGEHRQRCMKRSEVTVIVKENVNVIRCEIKTVKLSFCRC